MAFWVRALRASAVFSRLARSQAKTSIQKAMPIGASAARTHCSSIPTPQSPAPKQERTNV